MSLCCHSEMSRNSVRDLRGSAATFLFDSLLVNGPEACAIQLPCSAQQLWQRAILPAVYFRQAGTLFVTLRVSFGYSAAGRQLTAALSADVWVQPRRFWLYGNGLSSSGTPSHQGILNDQSELSGQA